MVPNYMSCVGVKTAADSNDITESSHDVKPTIGVLGFLIFIHLASAVTLKSKKSKSTSKK